MKKIRTLYVFRHGETDWNREGRMQGGTDVPLNPRGRKQAEKLKEFFAQHPVDVILSSDLSRALETARIAAGDSETPIVIDKRLRETNLGDAEGMTVEDIEEFLGAELMENWRNSNPDSKEFRFPNGESKAEHLARILEALDEFLASTDHGIIGVATHGGAMRRLIHHLSPELEHTVMVGNCTMYRITFDHEGSRWEIDLTPVCTCED